MFDPSGGPSVFAKIAVFNTKLSAVETEEGSIFFVGTPLEETLPAVRLGVKGGFGESRVLMHTSSIVHLPLQLPGAISIQAILNI